MVKLITSSRLARTAAVVGLATVTSLAIGISPAGASTRNPCQDLLNAAKRDVTRAVAAWSAGNDLAWFINDFAGAELAYDKAAFLFGRANNAMETYHAECG